MPAVRFPAILVTDPSTGLPLLEARGAVGNIVAEGTTTPLTLSKDKAGTSPIPQPITVTPGGYIETHWNQEGLTRATFVPLSGTWSTPLFSPQGLEEAAAEAAEAAEVSRQLAEEAAAGVAGAVRSVNGATPNAQGAVTITADIGEVNVDDLADATPLGKTVVKATTATEARSALGAGTSSLVAGWGPGQAAPAAETIRTTGTTATQVVDTKLDLRGGLFVPQNAFEKTAVVGLTGDLEGKASATLVEDLLARLAVLEAAAGGGAPVAPAPEFIARVDVGTDAAGTRTATRPSTAALGDIHVAAMWLTVGGTIGSTTEPATVVNAPTGWARIGTGGLRNVVNANDRHRELHLWWWRDDGTQASWTFTVTQPTSNANSRLTVVTYRNLLEEGNVLDSYSTATPAASSSTWTASAVNTAAGGCLLLHVWGSPNTVTGAATNPTETLRTGSGPIVSERLLEDAGLEPATVMTGSTSATNRMSIYTIALRAKGAGPGTGTVTNPTDGPTSALFFSDYDRPDLTTTSYASTLGLASGAQTYSPSTVWQKIEVPTASGVPKSERIQIVGPASAVPGTGTHKPSGRAIRHEVRPYPGEEYAGASRSEKYDRHASPATRTLSAWPDPVGSERWFGYSILFPSDFPIATNSLDWMTVTQIKGWGIGSPPVALEVKQGNLIKGGAPNQRSNSNDTTTATQTDTGLTRPWAGTVLGAITLGVWMRIVIGVNLQKDNTGWAEWWLNGTQVGTRQNGPTTDIYGDTGAAIPVYFKQGIYRTKSFTTTHVIWYGPTKIAPTRTEVM